MCKFVVLCFFGFDVLILLDFMMLPFCGCDFAALWILCLRLCGLWLCSFGPLVRCNFIIVRICGFVSLRFCFYLRVSSDRCSYDILSIMFVVHYLHLPQFFSS